MICNEKRVNIFLKYTVSYKSKFQFAHARAFTCMCARAYDARLPQIDHLDFIPLTRRKQKQCGCGSSYLFKMNYFTEQIIHHIQKSNCR